MMQLSGWLRRLWPRRGQSAPVPREEMLRHVESGGSAERLELLDQGIKANRPIATIRERLDWLENQRP